MSRINAWTYLAASLLPLLLAWWLFQANSDSAGQLAGRSDLTQVYGALLMCVSIQVAFGFVVFRNQEKAIKRLECGGAHESSAG